MRRNKGPRHRPADLLGLVLFTAIGLMTINPKHAYPLSVATKKPPQPAISFGTDFFGRDLKAAMVGGDVQTAVIGVIAVASAR